MKTRKDALQACSIVALFLGTTVTAQAHAIAAAPMAIAVNTDRQPTIAAHESLADCPGSLGHLRA